MSLPELVLIVSKAPLPVMKPWATYLSVVVDVKPLRIRYDSLSAFYLLLKADLMQMLEIPR
jgi:hypothetical protein